MVPDRNIGANCTVGMFIKKIGNATLLLKEIRTAHFVHKKVKLQNFCQIGTATILSK